MPELQLWTLEQSILGNGRKTRENTSLEQLIAWAHAKQLNESVPSLVWRTELALVYMKSLRTVTLDSSVLRLVKALGYRTEDVAPILNTHEIGVAPLNMWDSTAARSAYGRHSYKVSGDAFGVVWAWDPAKRLTKGIMFGSLDWDEGSKKIYRVLKGIRHYSCLRTNPLLLGLLALSAEMREQARAVRYWAGRLEGAQIKTGRHNFENHAKVLDTSGIVWAEMSGNVLGDASVLSACVVRLQILLQLADFIVEESSAACKADNQLLKQTGLLQSLQASNPQVSSIARQCRLRADCSLHEAQSFQWRAEILVQTVFTLTTQRDQDISIQIARDSKTLAYRATRDSTSMKAIAAVTMFFLPGTFVASLFAMPMFAWPMEPGRSISSQFWIYWAVTLPLTLTVVGIWLAWTNREDLVQFVVEARTGKSQHDSEKNGASINLPSHTNPS